MKRILLFLLVLQATALCQHGTLIKNPLLELPRWARTAFISQKLDSRYVITLRRYPHILKGDFNGDGRRDVALQIEEINGGREGIAIFHGPRPQAEGTHVVIIGAGMPSGEFPENLRSFPRWTLLSKENIERDHGPVDSKGDVIRLQTADSLSAFVYWDGKKYQWYTTGRRSKR